MKAVGIVVEYNPFHNGHHYQAKQARKETNSDVVIAVMSTSFLQRGEPAIVSKWTRTQMALANGIDIVVELPYLYATQKAELFAKGAVSILHGMGVSALHFGSESGEITDFIRLVDTMNKQAPKLDPLIRRYMDQGYSYPKASSRAFTDLNLEKQGLSLTEPNNILGFHYVKTIKERYKSIHPETTLRIKAHYHDETISSDSIASATSIRKAIQEGATIENLKHVIPKETLTALNNYYSYYLNFHTWDCYFPLLQYKIMTSTNEQLRLIYECEEGLEYRIKETIREAESFTDWMMKLKTKRYTRTRLQRLAVHILTNTSKETIANGLSTELPYIQLLGLTKNGQAYLSESRKIRQTELLTKRAKATGIVANLEEKATSVYIQPLPPKKRVEALRYEYQGPIILK